jgi:hypothetical protein
LFFLYFLMCRIGEASHPGPNHDDEKLYDGPLIGCINPTGILGKAQLIGDLPCGRHSIWAVSESHLTKPGRHRCQKELKFQGIPFSLQAGAPVAPKSSSVSAIGGKHKGVAFLSTTPVRPLSRTWDIKEWNEGRFHMACFHVGRRWIQGAVIYGFAANPEHISTRQATDKICQEVTTRMLESSSGLRFIAGDFNQEHGDLECMRHWEQQGWVNVQQWAHQKLGTPIRPTCKNKTTKDHLYVSPELAVYLESIIVDDTYFKDHAILAARFGNLGSPPKLPLWRMPKPIDWNEVPTLPDLEKAPQEAGPADTSAAYAEIMQQFEGEVNTMLAHKDKKPLNKQQLGRGQTREVHLVVEFSAPPKKGRPGDLETGYHGIDPGHSKWLRQARRLVNLASLTKVSEPTPTHQRHKNRLWQSILQASGFTPSFAAWWNQHLGAHAAIGEECPGPNASQIISECFNERLRAFEKMLGKQRVGEAKLRRNQNPNLIFRDLQPEGQIPCQSLLLQAKAQVVDVSQEDCSIEVQPEADWNPEAMLITKHGPVNIIHAEADKLWLDKIPGDLVDSPVSQDRHIGELNAMFDEFRKEWTLRWDKHLHTPDEFWDPLVHFTEQAFPKQKAMKYEPITYQVWRRTLKQKSKRAATGPDGLSRDDLLHMPKSLTMKLLALLEAIEKDGKQWPEQMVQAFVIALAKHSEAACVNDYRPISIFPVAYRTWSSIRARQVIAHLSSLVPSTCAGSVPHKSAHDVWFSILNEIEMAHHQGTEVAGGVIDLVKCFNLLPRVPVLKIMHHLQVAPEILRGWSAALVAMRRRFKLRNCVGPPVPSTTGFAEGCGLSVTAMLAVNIVAHRWMRFKHPLTQLWSFVDNLEVTSPNATQAKVALDALLDFMKVLDVQVDLSKTYVWSSTRSGRREMRHDEDQPFQIMFQARDLGGHMGYTLQHTNRTLTSRLEKMPELWNLLARSLAPYHQKLRALTAKAWPLALHGIQGVSLGEHHYTSLRTGATRGLKVHKSGMNPMVHLGLVEHPRFDPQFHAILQTAMLIRSHGPSIEQFEFILQELHAPWKSKQPPPGPCHVLLARIHQLGWAWRFNDVFVDHQGLPIKLLRCPIQELKTRLRDGWQKRVLGIIQARPTFEGAPYMSPQITTASMNKFPPEQQALLRTSLNGSFFTADHAPHQDPNASDLCKFCQRPDSQKHRHWECPYFSDCRQGLTTVQIDAIQQMPPVTHVHGWVPQPPTQREFQEMLLGIPDESTNFLSPPVRSDHVHAFTDGSCLDPTSDLTRLASWGVTIGSPQDEQFWPLANGLLPGYWQSTLRAETTAAIAACEFALSCNISITLWVDNDQVYKKVKRFQQGG